MEASTHEHPNPRLNRAIQYGALVVTVLLLAAAPLQVLLTIVGAPGGLFVCSAFFTVLLAMPVLMLTAYAPAVSVDDEGITLHPAVWKDRFVPWDAIRAVKVYPLLPTQDQEVSRRAFVGKRRYRSAAGIMLVIPGLPPQYRIAGFLAGERAAPVIALTNRAHSDYDRLVQSVLRHTNSGTHAPELTERR
jgi:hypothetical protein